ncbi:outer membrane protein [Pseudolabrys taiwanensis]|nr:outer membrane protein [Pseudolabrys taiwanensis]
MRKFSMALAGLMLAATSGAYAADLPRKAPMVQPVAPIQMYNWTGFYAGVNLGGGWTNTSSGSINSDLSGVIGGGQIGYNWQTGPILLGIEGDFQGSSQRSSGSATIGGLTYNGESKIPWFATVRGRLGYVTGPWLIYATGGAAWINYQLDITAPGGSVSDHTTKSGWTVGGGVEWMFMPNWSAKLEYLYLDTDTTTATLFGANFDARAKQNIVRAGLNYHF